MKPTRIGWPLVAALAAAFLMSPAHSANLISNGSFETGPDPGAVMTLPMSSTQVGGWIVTRDAIQYVGTDWNPAQGTRCLALNGSNAGGIAQTFSSVPGRLYTVKFFMAGDAFTPEPYVKRMRVQAAGLSQDYEFDAIHAWPWDLGWAERTFLFTANSSSTTLEFWSLDAGQDTGPALDHVVVLDETMVGVTPDAPNGVALAAPWPNPATGAFEVSFALPAATPIRLALCDLQGREVGVLAQGVLPAGRHVRAWGRDAGQKELRAGLYLLRLETPGLTKVRKVALTP